MFAIVQLALKYRYTAIVLAIFITIFGVVAAVTTPADIFPEIRIPVIAVVWTYRGLSPDDMSGRVTYYFERQLSTYVNDIEHIESQSLFGIAIIKIYFHPGADIRTATAEVTSVSQTVLKQMPQGITPPLVLNYNASTVPILQLALSSTALAEQEIYDLGQNFIRPSLATVQGAAVPSPYGGKERQIQIDLDPVALQSKGLSAQDVENAIAAQNQITPAGTTKIGSFEYNVELNDSPATIAELNDLPIATRNGATIYIRDIGHVRDGFPPQRNVVRVNGRRAALMSILKSGAVSTLTIVQDTLALLPRLKETLPSTLQITPVGDQSIFVKAAITDVVREGAIAAALTSLMILIFLGSWRSTLIIATSIPLAVLASIATLSALGQTLNIMTLSGLALAVGILVDDATVTIENVNWHLEQGKPIKDAIYDGARQIVAPAFVSLVCICIVFVPMFFFPGVSGFLFAPMAEAVMFAMIASFVLSRTLVPVMANYLLVSHPGAHTVARMREHDMEAEVPRSRNPFVLFQHAFAARLEQARAGYRNILLLALANRRAFILGFAVLVLASFGLVPLLGRDFFPLVDSGQMNIHVRAPIGTRIEETAGLFDRVEEKIRETIPPSELGAIIDNIGLPVSGLNRAYLNTGGVGPEDGDILVSLAQTHAPTAGYVKTLRTELARDFPGSSFAFLPADIVSQILNFGAPAPIDVMVTGPDNAANQAYAEQLLRGVRNVTGAADARIEQSSTYPQIAVDIDRTRADQLGITERDVTNSLVVNFASSFQIAPAFWLDPKNGASYPIVAQTPQYNLDSLSKLENLPVTGSAAGSLQVLGALGNIHRNTADAVVSHYAIRPAIDIYAAIQGRDLGAVASDIEKVLADNAKDRPKGATVTLRGQVETMDTAFSGLGIGLVEAIMLIYLLIVINFQSWADPFVIVSALPAALAGIVWMLFATHTTLSVPALTGAIMCMGVATANSVLVISFARERFDATGDAAAAALEAGTTRFRPVLMTALAMIIGMAPMALGLGQGGEQNAPLGRAVIGGLILATCATLVFVPVAFSLVHGGKRHSLENRMLPQKDSREGRVFPVRLVRRVAFVAGLIAVLVVANGVYVRLHAASEEKRWTADQSVPSVVALNPKPAASGSALTLPGTLEAFYTAPIYARVPGYVRSWSKDIGAHVHRGELLAEIDTPDVDQQIAQAQADLANAQASRKLSESTAERWANLLKIGAVSKQDEEEKSSDLAVKSAMVKSAQANLERLLTTKSFARIVAPFDGTVTERSIDIGNLVNAGAGSTGSSLFTVSDTHKMRVYVRVPQNYSAQIHDGLKATLTLPEYPGESFDAQLVTTSDAISNQSNTLLVQLEAENRDGKLKPGSYVQVSLQLPESTQNLSVPVSAVLFRGDGLHVATVGANGRVAMKTITIASDLGTEVVVNTGLSPSDKVIDNPPDSLQSGDLVRVANANTENDGKTVATSAP